MAEDFITIARVRKPQGRRGEVACELWTDFPEKFAERKEVSLLMPGQARRSLLVESHWLHKGMVVLKFAGFDSISEAESLQGAEIQVARESRVALQAGVYISDLTGCQLIDGSKALGTVNDVQFGAGDAPLLVVAGADGKEILVPFAEEFLVKVDTAVRRVEVKLPAGLLEVNAPLGTKERSPKPSAEKISRKKR